jgi:hypothetical protein
MVFRFSRNLNDSSQGERETDDLYTIPCALHHSYPESVEDVISVQDHQEIDFSHETYWL